MLRVPRVGNRAVTDNRQDLGEGTAVEVKAFLINAHASGAESCNCFLVGVQNNDFHLNLVTDQSKGTAKPVVMKKLGRDRDVAALPRRQVETADTSSFGSRKNLCQGDGLSNARYCAYPLSEYA